MKKKLYIRLVNNSDDISQKIKKYLLNSNISTNIISNIKPILEIKTFIKYKEIIDYIKNNNYFNELQNNIINQTSYNLILFEDNHDKKIIDMSNHNIRYASMIIYLFIKILNNQINSNVKKQIYAILKEIEEEKEVKKLYTWQEYYNSLNKKELCILQITGKGKDYINYFNIIYRFIKKIQLKITNILNNKINKLCPLESIILYYLIEIKHRGIYAEITMNELYNIIDIYSNSYDINYKGHKKMPM
jgi:hypothetical protein